MDDTSPLLNSSMENDGLNAHRPERRGTHCKARRQFGRTTQENEGIPPILTIEAVAALFGCSVQWVRAIPAIELPRHRVAKRHLYIRDEIVAFVRAQGRASLGADELVREAECEVLGSDPDSERRQPSRRAENASRS
jgi:hypothetical protein